MAKKIKAIVKLHIKAGQATPAPPVGPALAPHGLNIGEFCQKFNDVTKDSQGFKIPTVITIFEDRSYDFKLKTPPATGLILKAAGIETGSGKQLIKKAGTITRAQVKAIAEKKMVDLNANDINAAMKIIEGSCRSIGVEVKG